ncbi:DUF1778 domain-containing protein [Desulfosarcina sp. OttesenSCG-928-A07]|nr:DUF1778 domain-containing protein [Desulfosarcina sp. OttesenSCG-928-G17]MDL2329321.1 DUF1778 domain-containing protein [Desulfosarcina sp. OttesenSCG-928-A07]
MNTAIEKKTVRIDTRVPVHIKELLEMAASLQGITPTDLIVAAISTASTKIITDHNMVQLCLEDQKRLANALTEKSFPEPTDYIKKAVEDYKKHVTSK